MHVTCVDTHSMLRHEMPFFLFPAQQRLRTHYRVSLSLFSVQQARTAGAVQVVADANVDLIAGEEEVQ